MDLVRNLLDNSIKEINQSVQDFRKNGFGDPFRNEMMAMQFLNRCRGYMSFMESHRITQKDFYDACRDVEERQLVDELFLMLKHVQNNNEHIACLLAKDLIQKKIGELSEP